MPCRGLSRKTRATLGNSLLPERFGAEPLLGVCRFGAMFFGTVVWAMWAYNGCENGRSCVNV